jgi:hypothetical protein
MDAQESLVAFAETIAGRNLPEKVIGDGKESLKQRQARLKMQRDKLLLKKKGERETELKTYAESGGIGAQTAMDVTHKPDSVQRKRRITLASKIKASLGVDES